ncbi:MAG TPA: hypothetical protein VGD37_18840 [Kofleriaceae bacterium]|jgi:hypothetical protein
MNAFELSQHIAARLEEDQLDYAFGGALALTAWAIPRDTNDVDISVFASEAELPRVIDAIERAGVMIDRVGAAKSVRRNVDIAVRWYGVVTMVHCDART